MSSHERRKILEQKKQDHTILNFPEKDKSFAITNISNVGDILNIDQGKEQLFSKTRKKPDFYFIFHVKGSL